MIESLTHMPAFVGFIGLESTWEFLQKGGLFMVPLGLTSVAGAMAMIFKALSLTKGRVIPSDLAREVSRFSKQPIAGPQAPLVREIEAGRSTLARLCAVALHHRRKNQGEITAAVEATAREEILRLHAGISVLDTIITIAPLLGLLGTASGLVTIFQGLGENADHLAIARGIAEALTTTIFGLAIAVPCVVAHGYFVRRIELLTARMELLLHEFTGACETPNSVP